MTRTKKTTRTASLDLRPPTLPADGAEVLREETCPGADAAGTQAGNRVPSGKASGSRRGRPRADAKAAPERERRLAQPEVVDDEEELEEEGFAEEAGLAANMDLDLDDGRTVDVGGSGEADEEDGDGEDGARAGRGASLVLRRGDDESLPAVRRANLPTPRDSLNLYIREVSHFPLLRPDEEHDLAVRFRDSKDPDAAFRLVSSHLRLVVKIALDFQRRWMQNVLDLVQEGNVGLMHALYKFDPDKGIKFSYYASFWIKAYILKFIMDNFRMVKIGTTQVQRRLFFNLNRERQKLVAQGYDPDAEMLSRHLGVSVEDIREMDQRLSSKDVSLNVPVGDEENSATKLDFLPALGPGVEDSIADSEISAMLREKLAALLPRLNEKETYILKNRLLSDTPLTLREIGEKFHVTRERVRQLEIRLLEKIKKHLSMDIKDFSEEWLSQ